MQAAATRERLGGFTREEMLGEEFTFDDAMRVCDAEGITLEELEIWYRGSGLRYYEARTEAGLKPLEASEALGVTFADLYDWEAGKTEPPSHVVARMAKLYHADALRGWREGEELAKATAKA